MTDGSQAVLRVTKLSIRPTAGLSVNRKLTHYPWLERDSLFFEGARVPHMRMKRAFELQRWRGLSFTRQPIWPLGGEERGEGVKYFIRKNYGEQTEE